MRRWTLMLLAGMVAATLVFSPSSLGQQVRLDGKRKIVAQVQPAYPALARNIRLSGVVRLNATVAPDGKVLHTQVLGGNPVLVQSATDAVSKFTWVPCSTETKELVEIKFQLGGN